MKIMFGWPEQSKQAKTITELFTRQTPAVHTTLEKFENRSFTSKNASMVFLHTLCTPEKFEDFSSEMVSLHTMYAGLDLSVYGKLGEGNHRLS